MADEYTEIEKLAAVIHDSTPITAQGEAIYIDPTYGGVECVRLAEVILASPWLAAHDAQVGAQALADTNQQDRS